MKKKRGAEGRERESCEDGDGEGIWSRGAARRRVHWSMRVHTPPPHRHSQTVLYHSTRSQVKKGEKRTLYTVYTHHSW